MLLQILMEVKAAVVQGKDYIEIAFWCRGGKHRSVAAARIAEHILKVSMPDCIKVPRTRHMMRYWWSWIPCQIQARRTRSLLAYITLFVFNVHASCSC